MYLKENVFMDPNVCSRVIDGYRSIEIEEYNIKADLKYFTELLLKNSSDLILLSKKLNTPQVWLPLYILLVSNRKRC